MKLHALLLVAVGLMIGADAPKDDAAKKELKKLEGSYVMISGEEKGDKLPETTVRMPSSSSMETSARSRWATRRSSVREIRSVRYYGGRGPLQGISSVKVKRFLFP